MQANSIQGTHHRLNVEYFQVYWALDSTFGLARIQLTFFPLPGTRSGIIPIQGTAHSVLINITPTTYFLVCLLNFYATHLPYKVTLGGFHFI